MDARLQSDLTRLVKPDQGREPLPAATPLSAKLTGVGLSKSAGNAAAGIASPLTEADSADRRYHAEESLTSTDGLFVLKYTPIETIVMTDANGREVVFVYDAP